MHPATRLRIETILKTTPHALLISGARGSGKKFLAEHIAVQFLGKKEISDYPYILKIVPVKKSIGIEAIRELRSFLSRRTTGSGNIRRIVMIYEADLMTIEAQNALLKSVEEPPQDTVLILTASFTANLLPTILSRMQVLRVEPISKSIAESMLSNTYDSAALTSAYYISGGRAALLLALLKHETEHPLVSAIEEAKQLLKRPLYERLVIADELSKDREQLALLFDGLQRVIMSALQQAAAKDNRKQLAMFHNLSIQTQKASDALSANANPKLVISNLILQM